MVVVTVAITAFFALNIGVLIDDVGFVMYIGVIFGKIAIVVSGPLGPDSEYVYGVMQLRYGCVLCLCR